MKMLMMLEIIRLKMLVKKEMLEMLMMRIMPILRQM